MRLENSFDVPVGVDEAWPILLDIERIAPCLPGAAIDGSEGGTYTGRVKIKAGPVTVSYAGEMRMHDIDESQHSVVLEAQGKEQRGSGTVKADIAARVIPVGADASRVELQTDLAITGKPAQLGRGLIADVSGKIIEQFADNLAREMSGPQQPAAAEPSEPPAAGQAPPAAAPAPAADASLDLLALLKPYLAKAGAGLLGAILLAWVLKRLFRR